MAPENPLLVNLDMNDDDEELEDEGIDIELESKNSNHCDNISI